MTEFETADAAYKEAKQKLKLMVEAYEKDYRLQSGKIIKLRIARQNVCTHPSTRESQDINFHNNTEWTEVYCSTCDKLLNRV